MKGTEKQVKWAEQIREEIKKGWEELKAEIGTEPPEAVKNHVENEILGQEDANFFINFQKTTKRFGKEWEWGAHEMRHYLENLEGEIGDEAFDWTF